MSFTKPSVPKMKVPGEVLIEKSSIVTKLLPFICAGTAVGISVLALKELKKIKNEMVVLKNQQTSVKSDPEISKKMDRFEIELKKINEFLMNNNPKNPKIIKSVLKTEIPENVNIINEEPQEPEETEYEEVEVTDDEEDN